MKTKKHLLLPASILLSTIILSSSLVYTARLKMPAVLSETSKAEPPASAIDPALEAKVLPSAGVVLPVSWGNLGARLAESGVIDAAKFASLYSNEQSEEIKQLLSEDNSGNLKITPENSGMILNMFWALGLGNKNAILEKGPISDAQYGGAGGFASTGGWTIAQGDAMDHFSQHQFINLTPAQQQMVEEVSKNIYRPCCDNATYFPDCNHGMAMLGLLQLAASQGVSKEEMYKTALQVNAYWFPDTYLTIAQFLGERGVEWEKAAPQEILGQGYSSGSGYREILSQVSAPVQKSSGGGCGV